MSIVLGFIAWIVGMIMAGGIGVAVDTCILLLARKPMSEIAVVTIGAVAMGLVKVINSVLSPGARLTVIDVMVDMVAIWIAGFIVMRVLAWYLRASGRGGLFTLGKPEVDAARYGAVVNAVVDCLRDVNRFVHPSGFLDTGELVDPGAELKARSDTWDSLNAHRAKLEAVRPPAEIMRVHNELVLLARGTLTIMNHTTSNRLALLRGDKREVERQREKAGSWGDIVVKAQRSCLAHLDELAERRPDARAGLVQLAIAIRALRYPRSPLSSLYDKN